MATTEVEQLQEILTDAWNELAYKGDEIDGFVTVDRKEGDHGRWSHFIEIITRAPSGQHYRWVYEEGLTENQDDTGPAEYGPPELRKVKPVPEVQTIIKWVEE